MLKGIIILTLLWVSALPTWVKLTLTIAWVLEAMIKAWVVIANKQDYLK